MATNPFQRFARGAALTAPVARNPAVDVGGDVRRTESPSPVARKRKRSIKEEPEEEMEKRATGITSPSLKPASDEPHASTTATSGDHNHRRLRLLELLVEARRDGPDAAIDRFGTQACVYRPTETSAATQRFQILVAALLSSQTQDPVTHAAMQRLHTHLEDTNKDAEGLTIAKVRATSATRLEELLVPVGFYRRKAQQLKQVADRLHTKHQDDIPRSLDGLLALPGIGPKIARVILLLAWDQVDEGLIVDTHVHRLAQRLGWVGDAGTKTPEQTRAALDEWVPRSYWRDFSRLVVGFGQNVCVSVHPKCVECPLAPLCPSAFSYRHPAKQKKSKPSNAAQPTVELRYEHENDDVFDHTTT